MTEASDCDWISKMKGVGMSRPAQFHRSQSAECFAVSPAAWRPDVCPNIVGPRNSILTYTCNHPDSSILRDVAIVRIQS